MTRGKQIIEETKRIIAEAHERGNNDPMVDLAITLSFTLGARWADKNPHWISVEDEEPPKGQWIITHEPTSPIVIGTDIILADETVDEHHITHWMPLPQAPSSSEFPNNSKKGGENENN